MIDYTTSSLSFFLIHRAKRARHGNDARAFPSLNLNHSVEDDRQYSGICFTNTQLIPTVSIVPTEGFFFLLHLVDGTGYYNSACLEWLETLSDTLRYGH